MYFLAAYIYWIRWVIIYSSFFDFRFSFSCIYSIYSTLNPSNIISYNSRATSSRLFFKRHSLISSIIRLCSVFKLSFSKALALHYFICWYIFCRWVYISNKLLKFGFGCFFMYWKPIFLSFATILSNLTQISFFIG